MSSIDVAVGLVVLRKVGVHVVQSSLCGPCAAEVDLILGGVGSVEVLELGLASLGQNRVGILNTELGAVDGLNVGLVTLEHRVADLAVAVEINGVPVGQQIFADHLALQVACFGSVGADEADGSVRVEDGALVAVSLDGTVEEDNGGAVCHGDDLVGNVGGTGV